MGQPPERKGDAEARGSRTSTRRFKAERRFASDYFQPRHVFAARAPRTRAHQGNTLRQSERGPPQRERPSGERRVDACDRRGFAKRARDIAAMRSASRSQERYTVLSQDSGEPRSRRRAAGGKGLPSEVEMTGCPRGAADVRGRKFSRMTVLHAGTLPIRPLKRADLRGRISMAGNMR